MTRVGAHSEDMSALKLLRGPGAAEAATMRQPAAIISAHCECVWEERERERERQDVCVRVCIALESRPINVFHHQATTQISHHSKTLQDFVYSEPDGLRD